VGLATVCPTLHILALDGQILVWLTQSVLQYIGRLEIHYYRDKAKFSASDCSAYVLEPACRGQQVQNAGKANKNLYSTLSVLVSTRYVYYTGFLKERGASHPYFVFYLPSSELRAPSAQCRRGSRRQSNDSRTYIFLGGSDVSSQARMIFRAGVLSRT
jgi:hypothetical protein